MSYNDVRKTCNILVLGATGAGKSTITNVFPNLIKNECYDQVVESDDMKIVIGGQFDHNESNNSENTLSCHPIRFEANVKMSEGHRMKNQNNDRNIQGDITQRTQSYLFRTKDCDYRIIDTPGVQDVRGVEVDKKNFEEVIQYISQYDSIEAVLIVLGNDAARTTSAFRYSLQELLVHLHKDACQNIIFAFTHTIASNYSPGDSLKSLRNVLEKLKANNVVVPTTRENIFCFDSVWFRDLMITKNGFSASYEYDKMEDCFMKNKIEMERMLKKVKSNPSHRTMETVCLNRVRNLIYLIYRPLATVAKNAQENITKLQQKTANPFIDNNGNLAIETIQTNVIEVNYPITVCTGCATFEGRAKTPIYKECHQRCYLTGVQIQTLSNPLLKHCACMDGSGLKCAKCKCSWDKHMHFRYRLDKKVVVKHSQVKNGEAKPFLESMKNQNQQELEKIKKHSTEFCVYIKQNAIATTNDAYLEYLKFLSDEEGRKSGNSDLKKDFDRMIKEYEEQTTLIENQIKNHTRAAKTPREINDMLDELFNLPTAGPTLRLVRDLELRRLYEEGKNTDDVIIDIGI